VEEYNAENVLDILRFVKISLSSNEMDIFRPKFKEFFNSLKKDYDGVDAIWKFFSEYLPTETYPEDVEGNYYRRIARDEKFQRNLIDSGIAKKLREGMSLNDLMRIPKINLLG